MDIDKIIDIVRTLKEEGSIANVVGPPPAQGQPAPIEGIHGDPPVKKKRPTILARGLMPGSRTRWSKRIG
jgi:hypothetical protein